MNRIFLPSDCRVGGADKGLLALDAAEEASESLELSSSIAVSFLDGSSSGNEGEGDEALLSAENHSATGEDILFEGHKDSNGLVSVSMR